MKWFHLLLALLLPAMGFAQPWPLATANQAGITNVVVEDDSYAAAGRAMFRAFSVVDSSGIYGATLYGKMNFSSGKVYFWSSKSLRNTGDTSAAILAQTNLFVSGYGQARTVTLRTKNNSHASGTFQIIPNNGLVEAGNLNIMLVAMDVNKALVDSAIISAITAALTGGTYDIDVGYATVTGLNVNTGGGIGGQRMIADEDGIRFPYLTASGEQVLGLIDGYLGEITVLGTGPLARTTGPTITSGTFATSAIYSYATANRPAWFNGSSGLRSTSVTGTLDTMVTNKGPTIWAASLKGHTIAESLFVTTLFATDTTRYRPVFRCDSCYSTISMRADFLAGTGARLVTSTAAGYLANNSTIAGAYTWSGAMTFDGGAYGIKGGYVQASIPYAQYTNGVFNTNSFGNAGGAWPVYTDYIGPLAKMTVVNQGDGSGISIADPYAVGRVVSNLTSWQYSYYVDLIANDLGFNDSLSSYAKTFAAIVGWYGMDDSLKQKQEKPTYSGSWALDSIYTPNPLRFRVTSSAGAYVEFTTVRPSTAVFIGTILNSSGGDFVVTVDGVPHDTISTQMYVNHHSVSTAPGGYTIIGLTDAVHTIRLTATGSGTWRFAWSYGGGPRFPLGVRASYMGYSNFGVDRSGGTAKAGWARFVHAQDSVIARTNAIGSNARSVFVTLDSTSTVDFRADGVHPNEHGARKITDSIYAAFRIGTVQEGLNTLAAAPALYGVFHDSVYVPGLYASVLIKNGVLVDAVTTPGDIGSYGFTARNYRVGSANHAITYADVGATSGQPSWRLHVEGTVGWRGAMPHLTQEDNRFCIARSNNQDITLEECWMLFNPGNIIATNPGISTPYKFVSADSGRFDLGLRTGGDLRAVGTLYANGGTFLSTVEAGSFFTAGSLSAGTVGMDALFQVDNAEGAVTARGTLDVTGTLTGVAANFSGKVVGADSGRFVLGLRTAGLLAVGGASTFTGKVVGSDSGRFVLGLRTAGLLMVGGASTFTGKVTTLDTLVPLAIRATTFNANQQAATFGGSLTAGGVLGVNTSGTADLLLSSGNGSSFGQEIAYKQQDGTVYWVEGHNTGSVGYGNFTIYRIGLGSILTLDGSSGAAGFYGTVSAAGKVVGADSGRFNLGLRTGGSFIAGGDITTTTGTVLGTTGNFETITWGAGSSYSWSQSGGIVNATSTLFKAGAIWVPSLAGSGNDYACLDSDGVLYRSNAAC